MSLLSSFLHLPPRQQALASAAGTLHGLGGMVRAVLGYAPGRSVLAAGLLLASAVTETFGIALIIPFLSLAGLGDGEGGASRIGEVLQAGAAALGLPLTLPVLLGAFVLLAAVRSCVAWQNQVHLAVLRHAFVDHLRECLYTTTANAEWTFLLRRRRSDLQHVLADDVNRVGNGATHLIQVAVTVTFALAQIALALAISASITLGMLLVGAVLLAAGHSLLRRSRMLGGRLTAGGRAMHAAMAEFLG